jgi:hypothetical protein
VSPPGRGSRHDRTYAWADWAEHTGAAAAGNQAPVLGRDGKVRVFYRTGDNRLEVITQNEPNGVFGSPEELARNIESDPVAALGADGRIYVFYRGSDNTLWYTRNQGLWYEAYTKAASVGGVLKEQPAAALDGSGRIVVGVRGADNGLYTTQQKSENSPDFGSFSK